MVVDVIACQSGDTLAQILDNSVSDEQVCSLEQCNSGGYRVCCKTMQRNKNLPIIKVETKLLINMLTFI